MRPKHLLLCTALLLPVTLLSCDDSGSGTPTETAIEGTGADDPSFNQSSAGESIRCFSGTEDSENDPTGETNFNGVCERLSNIKNGANVSTFDDDLDDDNSFAGIFPKKSRIKGKKLVDIREIEFHYAGGPPSGGAPRLSIAIDDCVAQPPLNGANEFAPPPTTCETDGKVDNFAFIDANGCNKSDREDGDAGDDFRDNAFVGEVDPGDDDTCLTTNNGITYPNFEAFVAANPQDRIARDQETFVIIDQPAHYLLYGLQFR